MFALLVSIAAIAVAPYLLDAVIGVVAHTLNLNILAFLWNRIVEHPLRIPDSPFTLSFAVSLVIASILVAVLLTMVVLLGCALEVATAKPVESEKANPAVQDEKNECLKFTIVDDPNKPGFYRPLPSHRLQLRCGKSTAEKVQHHYPIPVKKTLPAYFGHSLSSARLSWLALRRLPPVERVTSTPVIQVEDASFSYDNLPGFSSESDTTVLSPRTSLFPLDNDISEARKHHDLHVAEVDLSSEQCSLSSSVTLDCDLTLPTSFNLKRHDFAEGRQQLLEKFISTLPPPEPPKPVLFPPQPSTLPERLLDNPAPIVASLPITPANDAKADPTRFIPKIYITRATQGSDDMDVDVDRCVQWNGH